MRNFIDIITENAGDPFEQWFGDSKVVDEAGRPLIVYHGTNQTFDAFSKEKGGMVTGAGAGAVHGFFFTDDRDEAQQYAEGAGRKVFANMDAFEAESERLRIASERLEQVAQRTGRTQDWRAYEEAYETWERFETDAPQADPMENVQVVSVYLSLQNPLVVDFGGSGGLTSAAGGIDEVVDAAVAQGHDGVIMRNINDSPLGGFVSDHYVAFSPEQIRRA